LAAEPKLVTEMPLALKLAVTVFLSARVAPPSVIVPLVAP
jgi:hypothetical protein